MYNYRAVLQYDGGRYDGWQRMGGDSTTNTIEYRIAEVLKKMSGEEPEIFAGCRTEKGVHALGQVISFKLNSEHEGYEIRNYLNRYLPRDIAVLQVEAVEDRFHAQLNAREKSYEYRLDTASIANVFTRKYCYHTFELPDVDAMRKAAAYFEGSHDFKALNTAKKAKSTVKKISDASVEEKGDSVIITLTANDFLHNMARLMVGLLLDVGAGIKKPEDVKRILEGEKVQVSLPAESYGLFLKEVLY